MDLCNRDKESNVQNKTFFPKMSLLVAQTFLKLWTVVVHFQDLLFLNFKLQFSVPLTFDRPLFKYILNHGEPDRPLVPAFMTRGKYLSPLYVGLVSTIMAWPDFFQYPAFHRPILPNPLHAPLPLLVKVNSTYIKCKVWPRQPCCTG